MKKSKLVISTFLCASAISLSSCDAIDQEKFKSDFLDNLFPDPYDALAIFIAFIILLVAVFFFAYKPVKALIKKSGDYVEEKIDDANKNFI